MDHSPLCETLTPDELAVLGSAAAWYAKYHAQMITESADDPSASAMVERENYLALLDALRKLGFRVRNPLPASSRVAQREAA